MSFSTHQITNLEAENRALREQLKTTGTPLDREAREIYARRIAGLRVERDALLSALEAISRRTMGASFKMGLEIGIIADDAIRAIEPPEESEGLQSAPGS